MIRIASIEKESTVDGEGWRYVIFTQGCNHNCKGCHNPQSHDFDGGKEVRMSALVCLPAGYMSVRLLLFHPEPSCLS